MRDPELVARAQRAAARLESAWEQWRALHGLAVAPSQPIVSYVGYSLKEPWGEPRVVIGIDADEAEYLADFLDRDECAQRGQPDLLAELTPRRGVDGGASPLESADSQQIPLQQVVLAEQQAEGGSEYPGSALVGTPVSVGVGGQPDQTRDIAAELAGWTAGELPGQATEQLNGWSASAPAATEQPPATA
jgi:hypothetical protein